MKTQTAIDKATKHIKKLKGAWAKDRQIVVKLLQDENWIELGWFFWNAFIAMRECGRRRQIVKMWNGIPNKLQNACDGI